MAKVVLILGNGFDIDLGLKSKYIDFIKEEEWRNLCDSVINKFPEKFQIVSLLKHIQNAGNTPSLWFDVENEIHNFILNYPKRENEIPENLKELHRSELTTLRKALYLYLQRITKEFKFKEEKWSYRLIKSLTESNNKVKVFTFNYTNTCELCKLPPIDFTYIHGNLEDNNIVVGCEPVWREYIPMSFRFLLKSNMVSNPNNIIENLWTANEVIFFGHSLNVFDYSYFKEFFDYICSPIDHELNLTFITKNQKSEEEIRINLFEQGIDVRNLFKSNIKTTFIHTEQNEYEVLKDQDSFNFLLERIKGT